MDVFPDSTSPYNAFHASHINEFSIQNATGALVMTSGRQSSLQLGHLAGLVFEAVMEVVVVALPGYFAAKYGGFNAGAQKKIAELNITVFTPCLSIVISPIWPVYWLTATFLVFSKIARQLSKEKFAELAIIPVILLIQTVLSFMFADLLCRWPFGLRKLPQKNFVKAMAVFGNSNSLPLSLVISLSHTISGLHWDKIPGDNDDSVAARGILYLLIFSQLGQIARWSWGMNSLLKPLSKYTPEERGEIPRSDDEAIEPYYDDPLSNRNESEQLTDGEEQDQTSASSNTATENGIADEGGVDDLTAEHATDESQGNGVAPGKRGKKSVKSRAKLMSHEVNDRIHRINDSVKGRVGRASSWLGRKCANAFHALPAPLQKTFRGIYSILNVPLIAIIASVVVALVPALKSFFFTPGTFVNNSITAAIDQSGGVAVPLILVVLGANLARNTLPDQPDRSKEEEREEKKMIIVALLSRMLLPMIVMVILLALAAKFIPISTLDDPIFVIVCFLLSGAPSALQLSQICQVNDLYVRPLSKILFQSYVVW